MKLYIVIEVVYLRYPPTLRNRLLRLGGSSATDWNFDLADGGRERSAYGNATIFTREDAARKGFRGTTCIGWPGSSVYFIFADALTRKGAVQKAIANIVGGPKRGEVLDELHHGKDRKTGQKLEATNGNS